MRGWQFLMFFFFLKIDFFCRTLCIRVHWILLFIFISRFLGLGVGHGGTAPKREISVVSKPQQRAGNGPKMRRDAVKLKKSSLVSLLISRQITETGGIWGESIFRKILTIVYRTCNDSVIGHFLSSVFKMNLHKSLSKRSASLLK